MTKITNIWNTSVDTVPVDLNSTTYINTIGAETHFHADFGSGLWNGGTIGIPFNIISSSQAKVAVTFDYDSESDPGPYRRTKTEEADLDTVARQDVCCAWESPSWVEDKQHAQHNTTGLSGYDQQEKIISSLSLKRLSG